MYPSGYFCETRRDDLIRCDIVIDDGLNGLDLFTVTKGTKKWQRMSLTPEKSAVKVGFSRDIGIPHSLLQILHHIMVEFEREEGNRKTKEK